MTNAFWDDRYSTAAAAGDAVWSIEPNAWIEQVTGTLPPGNAIDLASGEGRNALCQRVSHFHRKAVNSSFVWRARETPTCLQH